MSKPTQAETIAGMKEHIRAQSIEIRDLKVANLDNLDAGVNEAVE